MFDLSQLTLVLKKMFSEKSYGENLENYILSKHPKTVGDIEHLAQQYQRNRDRSMLWL